MRSVRYFLTVLTTLEFTRQILMKVTNTEFHGCPSNEDRADIYGQTDGTKLTYAFRVHTNAPKNRLNTRTCL